ncbi:DMT family transporter [Alkanindiges sp. WGS2144]|uniref:DMT family transporter n=1 Tax=Alkanindiges sp. WGS2144 TaxID=3366808 RepID=UPI003750AED9
MATHSSSRAVLTGLILLSISAFLFATMGVLIRMASHTVDNATIVFFRNATGLLVLMPLLLAKGLDHLKTSRLWMHSWRAIVGLIAMYGFFYAIAHLKLSNAMVFTYSSPVFIPVVAWLFLKEKMTFNMLFAASLGLLGVVMVAKPDSGMFNALSAIGLMSSFLAAMAFVTVRALTDSEPATRIVFYFCFIGTLLSAIPMFWLWRSYSQHELMLLCGAGALATLSQICLSKAYSFAPAGQIGPANYLAIIFAGIWAASLWSEYPDQLSIIGMVTILMALLLCMPRFSRLFPA